MIYTIACCNSSLKSHPSIAQPSTYRVIPRFRKKTSPKKVIPRFLKENVKGSTN